MPHPPAAVVQNMMITVRADLGDVIRSTGNRRRSLVTPTVNACWRPNVTNNTPATTKSAISEPEDHSYRIPPKLMPIVKETIAPISRAAPMKSIPANRLLKEAPC